MNRKQHKKFIEETLVYPFVDLEYATVINCNAEIYKDFKCMSVEGNCTIHLLNVLDGDCGMIELHLDSTGGYTITLGSEFTKKIGIVNIQTTANADNFISYRVVGSDIVYIINYVQ
jgi:hypothetical protein